MTDLEIVNCKNLVLKAAIKRDQRLMNHIVSIIKNDSYIIDLCKNNHLRDDDVKEYFESKGIEYTCVGFE
jgi:hypothetical protein